MIKKKENKEEKLKGIEEKKILYVKNSTYKRIK